MVKSICVWIGVLSTTFLTLPAFAVHVSSIYQAALPVMTQASLERDQAVNSGLGQVLVKACGNKHVLENASLASALNAAAPFLQTWRYSAADGAVEQPYVLKLQFNKVAISHLLQQAGEPIWDDNRPLLLAVVQYQAPSQAMEILDNNFTALPQQLFKKAMSQYGLPFILPAMDVNDLNQINDDDVAARAVMNLQAVAKRYNSDALLVGQVAQISSGITSQWTLQLDKDEWSWSIAGNDLADNFAQLAERIATAFTARYVSAVTSAHTVSVTLAVEAVSRQADLLNVMQFLQGLPAVTDVQLVQVLGKRMVLNMNISVGIASFTQMLAINHHLEMLRPGAHDNTLTYQWRP